MERLGRYQLGKLLGEGGAGRVREAELDVPGGARKRVALKVLHRGSDELRREARIGGLLRHRHLVDVYEIGERDGTWFCAMELCDGALAAHIPLPPRAVVEVGVAVCQALQYAHDELGLVHLDLKPDNLLLKGATVKVADLGIARADGFEHDGRIRGTRGYMAPEQARGEPVDSKADVYALAVTLLELAGVAPTLVSETMDWATGSAEPLRLTETGDIRGETLTLEDVAELHSLAPSSETLTVEDLEPEVAAPGDERLEVRAAARPARIQALWVPPPPTPDWLAAVVEPCLAPAPADRPTLAALAEALRHLPVSGAGLRAHLGVAPAVRTPRRAGTNLEAEPDAFVGRRTELARLAELIAGGALITLKGPGGVGKSRLARNAASRWRARHGGQAWFCDLQEARSLEGLCTAVARALDVPLGHRDPVETLGHALASRGPTVVILDNFEQIADLAGVVARWRAQAPDTCWLVTSRVPLGLDAEQLFDVDVLSAADARDLIVARARARGAEVGHDPDLSELAARLEGLPLALELAAGRLGVLSVRDVLDRLGLSLLRRGTSDRHGTLQAALDWSWDLLSSSDRSGLAQLSVFVGGFTVEAAEGVIDVSGAAPVDIVDRLVESSWLTARDGRFAMLESVRVYAASKLDERDGPRARHGRWFAALPSMLGPPGATQRLRVLRDELLNLQAACRRAIARGDGEVAVATLEAAWEVLSMRGPYAQGLELAASVAAMPLTGEVRGRALLCLGSAYRNVGRIEAAGEQLEAASTAFRDIGSRFWEGVCLGHIGALYYAQGRMDEARAQMEVALAIHREVGNRRSEAIALGHLGNVAHAQGRLEQTRSFYDQALALHREEGDRRLEGVVLGNLAVLLRSLRQLDASREVYRSALAIHHEVGDRGLEGVMLGNLGVLLHTIGELDEARSSYEAALQIHREVGNLHSEGFVLANLAELLHDRGDLDQGRTRYREALASQRAVRNQRLEGTTWVQLARLERDAGDPDAALEALARAEALLAALDARPQLAGLWVTRAEILHRQGRLEAARGAIGEAASLGAPEARLVALRTELDGH